MVCRSKAADERVCAVLVPVILAAVLFVGFLIWEGKIARHPVIPLSVFGVSPKYLSLFAGLMHICHRTGPQLAYRR